MKEGITVSITLDEDEFNDLFTVLNAASDTRPEDWSQAAWGQAAKALLKLHAACFDAEAEEEEALAWRGVSEEEAWRHETEIEEEGK